MADQFENSHLVINNGQCVAAAKIIVSDQANSLLQLQIAPTEQGKGLGTQVIDAQKALTYENNLSVLKANPANELYHTA
ncbi:GNAT family N-acetyltransferase, partial [Pseudoalteromonas sp. S4389]|uniref:GNAT family N-acetyltransferase n=1 Tax=Pseudoalteromonas sp. S4389 TaxID=579556 RepID=UPI001109FCFA